jgi:hypothetical protein
MRKNTLLFGLWMLVSGLLPSGAGARHKDKVITKKDDHAVVVIVREGKKDLEYQIGSDRYNRHDAAFALGELRLTHEPNAAVVVLIEDKVRLAGLSVVPSMAIDAGFTNVHTYVFWPWTGKMAEVQFGPVLKFSKTPPPPAE